MFSTKQYLIVISIIIITLSLYRCGGSIIKKFSSGFYFEKYDTDNIANDEVRELKAIALNKHKWSYVKLNKNDYEKIKEFRKTKNYRKDATTELLKLHPVGSSIAALIQTIEKAGAKCTAEERKIIDYTYMFEGHESQGKKPIYVTKSKIISKKDYMICEYEEKWLLTGWWVVIAYPDPNDLTKIVSAKVSYHGTK